MAAGVDEAKEIAILVCNAVLLICHAAPAPIFTFIGRDLFTFGLNIHQ
jgi:hypothetical protein